MKFNILGFVKRRLLTVFGRLLALTLMLQGLILGMNAAAIAAPIHPSLIATSASSLSKEAAGKARSDLGTAQKRLSKVSGEIRGTTNQVKGRVQEDTGKIQSKLEDTQQSVKNRARKGRNQAENAADRASNRIAETTDQASDQVQETTENAVDSVKKFFGQ